jgi:hypothetical protein
MSTESTAPLRTIRMSDQDWNELLVTAVNAEYKNRADYIRAVLRSKQPPAEMLHAAPISVKDLEAEIETYKEKWQASVAAYDKLAVDARSFLSRAETAEAEIPRLKAAIQAASLGHSVIEKKPVHRFSLSSIVKRWPEARQARYVKLGSPPDEWIKAALETVYDMLDEY